MPEKSDEDADADIACRVEVMETCLIVDQALRVRFSHAALWGRSSIGRATVLQAEGCGIVPHRLH